MCNVMEVGGLLKAQRIGAGAGGADTEVQLFFQLKLSPRRVFCDCQNCQSPGKNKVLRSYEEGLTCFSAIPSELLARLGQSD